MSEENKTVELKDEELEKAAGGYQVNFCDFDEGDCFKGFDGVYKVLHNYINVRYNSFVECLRQDNAIKTIIEEMPQTPVKFLAEECDYLGRNIF